MKILNALVFGSLVLCCSTIGFSGEEQKITRAGERDARKGPADIFTGNVRIEPVFTSIDGISAGAGMVTFEPGARSNWHTHPAGQQIFVISGVGRTGTWDGKVEEIRAGDVVTCPKGVKHWHGAASNVAMTHLTVTGELDGKNVDWLEAVTDEQYNK
jgi:Uncharacterized conserved protein, contains double-stranded beta-helix domain